MATENVVTARILIRRGKQIDLPQPLDPGEMGLCTDTGRVFIGADQSVSIGNISNTVRLYDATFQDASNLLLQNQFYTLKYTGTPTDSEMIDDFMNNSTPPITDPLQVRLVRNDASGWAFFSVEPEIPGLVPPQSSLIGVYAVWDILNNYFSGYDANDTAYPSLMVIVYQNTTNEDYYNLVNLINATATPEISSTGVAFTNQNIEIYTNFSKNVGGGGGGEVIVGPNSLRYLDDVSLTPIDSYAPEPDQDFGNGSLLAFNNFNKKWENVIPRQSMVAMHSSHITGTRAVNSMLDGFICPVGHDSIKLNARGTVWTPATEVLTFEIYARQYNGIPIQIDTLIATMNLAIGGVTFYTDTFAPAVFIAEGDIIWLKNTTPIADAATNIIVTYTFG